MQVLNKLEEEEELGAAPLSSAEAPAGYPHQNINNRQKIESARGTMGRGKRREPLPYNVSKMAPNFRGRLDLGGVPHKYLQHGGTYSATRRGSCLSF